MSRPFASRLLLSASVAALYACGGSTPSTPISVPAPPEGDNTYKCVTAAQKFLESLDGTQKSEVRFDYDDSAQRTRWSNLPTGGFQRKGVKLGSMTQTQQQATFELLATLLSAKGYQQVVDAVNADEVLKSTTTGGPFTFGRAEYYISILGTPSATSPWRVQFGGHHMALNATIVGADITLAPSLTGAQPAIYTANGVTIRPQGGEVDKSFELINALGPEQQQKAILGASPIDLVLGPGKDGKTLTSEGINASELTAGQQALLLALIQERVGLLNDEDTAVRMADIQSHLAETYLAWYGPVTPGSAAYFRVTGPTLFIEYSPQQMGGSAVNHTHAMYRDFANDYGAGYLE
ncbi:MAG TPA: DUF3500 domain-containing protein [Archangium sp.]|uniref:DUF3500 domain-containing protein n=1 Tax=Archangium sp. TaxID=1872627 RepID=UPI002E303A4B|nr:DUF3500 domain-containing protein [Archangium sp.]HEX5749688.1 DUF3500 domain-containing protein [Archangium sp.]